MTDETKSPNLKLAAHLLRRMIDASAADPLAADIARLDGWHYEVALSVWGEGRDKQKRRERLEYEIKTRGLDFLQDEIDRAEPKADLTTLQTSNAWETLDLADFIDEELPPTEYLVFPFVTIPSVTIVYARPKKLKSLITLDLALCVAGGYSWLPSTVDAGDGFTTRAGRVLLLDLENGKNTMKRRVKAFATVLGFRPQPGQLLIVSLPYPMPDLSKPEQIEGLIFFLKGLGKIDLLVADHLGMLMAAAGIDENSSQAELIMAALRHVANECNLSMFAIHHANKFQKDGQTLDSQIRGSGAITAGIDAGFYIDRDETDRSLVKVVSTISRFAEPPNVQARFTFEQDENKDLTAARFYRVPWKEVYEVAREYISSLLQNGKELNSTKIKNAVKESKLSGITDQVMRATLDAMEARGDLVMRPGANNSKNYSIPVFNGDDDDD
jgi:hypothetical protein